VHISVGPGSFTGLRVGITLAKTFAFSTGARLVAVPSAEVIVENLPPEARHGIVVLDAKRGQIFTARFTRGADGAWRGDERAHLDILTQMLERAPRPVYLIGEGIPYHRAAIPEADDVVVAHEGLWTPRAAVVGRLGARFAAEGRFVDPFRLVPTYVRLAEAEEKRLIAEGRLRPDGTPMD
jgi:tRNA threonylcarbamoyladenosine biosynthesis protein TsaB